jgi:hypothetical protein
MSPRIKRLAPFFLLGPISGPLTAGVVLNLHRRNYTLAGMYAVLLAETFVALPLITAKLGLDALGVSVG